jgi:tetratricopeptide (TPR) repeat protein
VSAGPLPGLRGSDGVRTGRRGPHRSRRTCSDYLGIGERAARAGNRGRDPAYGATTKEHPDYSEAHGRLGKIYLDERNDFGAAIREFENVLALPANRQLIYKQFAVMFTNLGHAYYEKGNELVNRDKEAAAQNLTKALQNLQTARQNTRFFPTRRYEEAVHDTYYYTALSYHKLYLMTKKASLLDSANHAWRDYFDFFPEKLEGHSAFEQSRQAARSTNQLRDKITAQRTWARRCAAACAAAVLLVACGRRDSRARPS